MKKTIIVTLLIFIMICKVFGQNLSINETISYINNSLFKNNGSGCSEALVLSQDGSIKLNVTVNCSWCYLFNVADVVIDKIGPDQLDFWLLCKPGNDIDIFRRPKCIKTINLRGEYIGSQGNALISTSSPQSLKNLHRAFKYLFELIETNATFRRIDNDPFATKTKDVESTIIINPSTIKKSISDPKVVQIRDANSSDVKIEIVDGMYHINVNIGNIERKFVLDSGASDISISEDLENELIKNGVVKRDNYKASALYKLADGSIVEKRRLTLPALTVGNFTLTNVSASIGIGSTPLLLGKSFLDRFKSWTIDNSSQILKLEK